MNHRRRSSGANAQRQPYKMWGEILPPCSACKCPHFDTREMRRAGAAVAVPSKALATLTSIKNTWHLLFQVPDNALEPRGDQEFNRLDHGVFGFLAGESAIFGVSCPRFAFNCAAKASEPSTVVAVSFRTLPTPSGGPCMSCNAYGDAKKSPISPESILTR